jgi:hypothetical protein
MKEPQIVPQLSVCGVGQQGFVSIGIFLKKALQPGHLEIEVGEFTRAIGGGP